MTDKDAVAEVDRFIKFVNQYFDENPNHLRMPVLIDKDLLSAFEKVAELAKEDKE